MTAFATLMLLHGAYVTEASTVRYLRRNADEWVPVSYLRDGRSGRWQLDV